MHSWDQEVSGLNCAPLHKPHDTAFEKVPRNDLFLDSLPLAASPSLEPQALSLTSCNPNHRSCPWLSLSQSCPAMALFQKVSEDCCKAVQQYFCFLKTILMVFMAFLMLYNSPCYFILASINEVSLNMPMTPAFQWCKDANFGEFFA